MPTQMFSYVVKHDFGFAPNPFSGYLTLATCKPRIRAAASVGDYLVGTGSTTNVGTTKLIYAARIAKVISIEDYGRLPEYANKRPSDRGEQWRQHGDNIYFVAGGKWKQRPNPYHSADRMEHDLGGSCVLICKQFWYFGDAAFDIPAELREAVKRGPGHKRIMTAPLVQRFIRWLGSLPQGIHGQPADGNDAAVAKCSPARCGGRRVVGC